MKQNLLAFLFFTMFLLPDLAVGQGATTASISGLVSSSTGETLPGANVIAVHEPTGTRYGTVTRPDGRFNLPNLRTGGPYTIAVSFVGYGTQQKTGINLALGQEYTTNFTLSEAEDQLDEVVVTAEVDPVLNSGRTGAATNISSEELQTLPTLSRSLGDFTRLTPQANGNSFGGVNNRFNNITIDGAVNNDVFGLSGSGAPGGQAGAQPISLDAIQEIQVVLAPYDVTLGNFTGGGINAITRSGTNEFAGSVYYFARNENTIGNDPETGEDPLDFKENQYGVRLGGPVIKNKLFFFVNADFSRRAQPLTFNAGEPGAVLSVEDAETLSSFLIDTYGYDPGGFGPSTVRTESDRFFARLDWNISTNHQLTLRHNYVNAFDDNISRSNSLFRFGNNAYTFNNTTNSTVLEFRSQFSNNYANKLIVGYSSIRDNRETLGELFPQVTINFPGTANRLEFGSQRSSVANELDQDIFEFTDNFKIYAGDHIITLGTHNEFFKFRNLFINNVSGRWDFGSLADFYADEPSRVRATYSLIPGNPRPAAEFNAAQLGFYAQDEYAVNEQLTVTAGLRLDVPLIPDAPANNPLFAETFDGKRTDETPNGQLLWAPRVGFNWDATGDRTLQVRGGTGIFTGRVPFVWLSNQYTNTGTIFGTVDIRGNNNINGGNGFEPNPELQGPNLGRVQNTVEVNAIDQNFRIPQVWRSNLATDIVLPGGVVATLEGIYTRTLNSIKYQDINLTAPAGELDESLSGGADTRDVYPIGQDPDTRIPYRRIEGSFTNAIFLTNTDEGYAYSLTGQLRKEFESGLNAMVAYTYGKSKDINSGASSTALSNWEYNQIVSNPNDPALAYSNFDLRHRIIGNLGYRLEYGNHFATSVSLFYAGNSGTPFTYLYFGDLNNDGARENDLLFVPEGPADIKLKELVIEDRSGNVVATYTPEQQWAALNEFIENDDYLSTRRGQYAERNGARTPWEHHFDLRLMQDFYVKVAGERNTIQLTLDVFNIGNLISDEWGRSYFVSNQAVTLVTYDDNLGRRLANEDGFTFNPTTSATPWGVSQFGSRWQGQIGVRYIFGN